MNSATNSNRSAAVVIGLLLASSATCSDDADNTTTSSSSSSAASTAQGTGGGVQVPPDSCVQPGDMGNENGVGEPCTPGGDECDGFDLAPICLADFAQDEWMCTRLNCTEATDCGTDAGCLITDQGSACVPCRCSSEGIGCPGAGGSGGAGGAGGG